VAKDGLLGSALSPKAKECSSTREPRRGIWTCLRSKMGMGRKGVLLSDRPVMDSLSVSPFNLLINIFNVVYFIALFKWR